MVMGLLMGCGELGPGPSVSAGAPDVVWDSAGVQIIEHTGLPEGLPTWGVGATPALSIGSLDGDGPDVFSRVAGLALRGDGVILALDQTAMELRAFDAEGRHLWSAGRAGEGPGEFRAPGAVAALPGDSALVVDLLAARVLVFDPDGAYRRAVPLQTIRDDLGSPLVRGVTGQGHLVVSATAAQSGAAPEAGPRRSSSVLAFLDPEGRPAGVSARAFPGAARESREVEVSGPDGAPITAIAMSRMVMGPESVFAPAPGGAVVGVQDAFELFHYQEDGTLDRILRVRADPVPVDRDRLVERGLDEIDDPARRREIRQERERMLVTEVLPAFDRVMVDRARRLWIEEFVPLYEDREPEWWVVDAEGAFVATASFPAGFSPHVITEEHVLGLRPGDFDVPFVEVRVLETPGR